MSGLGDCEGGLEGADAAFWSNAAKRRAELRRKVREARVSKNIALHVSHSEEADVTAAGLHELPMRMLIELATCYSQMQSSDEQIQTNGVVGIRKALSIERDPPIDDVIRLGCLPLMLKLLDSPNHKIQFEACWAITNVASGVTAQLFALAKMGVVPKLLRLLETNRHNMEDSGKDLVDQAVWALGNIAGDCYELRDHLLSRGVMGVMVELAESAPLQVVKTAVWVISNLIRGTPPPPDEMVAPAIPLVLRHAVSLDRTVQDDSLWALFYYLAVKRRSVALEIPEVVGIAMRASPRQKASISILSRLATTPAGSEALCASPGVVEYISSVHISNASLAQKTLAVLATICEGSEQREKLLVADRLRNLVLVCLERWKVPTLEGVVRVGRALLQHHPDHAAMTDFTHIFMCKMLGLRDALSSDAEAHLAAYVRDVFCVCSDGRRVLLPFLKHTEWGDQLCELLLRQTDDETIASVIAGLEGGST